MLKIYLTILAIIMIACTGKTTNSEKDNVMVRIETSIGNIDIKLYDETPLHRDNFITLINEGFYDDQLFHRVINDFMIQGGDPDSKKPGLNTQLGSGGPGYKIPAEINADLFHKKGALAAARLGDNVNPEKESSGSQFYIVKGTVFTMQELDDLELKINNSIKQQRYSEIFRDLEKKYLNDNITPDYNEISRQAAEIITEDSKTPDIFKFSEQQRDAYTETGGTPHLDGSYTVFGETINGFDVIDAIASQQTDSSDRPIEDIKMKIVIL